MQVQGPSKWPTCASSAVSLTYAYQLTIPCVIFILLVVVILVIYICVYLCHCLVLDLSQLLALILPRLDYRDKSKPMGLFNVLLSPFPPLPF